MEKERGKHRAGQSSKGPPHACVCTAAAASSLAASSTAARDTLIAHLALSLSFAPHSRRAIRAYLRADI